MKNILKTTTILLVIGAVIDTIISLTNNQVGLLEQTGLSAKSIALIKIIGLVYSSISASILGIERFGKDAEIGGSNVPPNRDQK